MNVAKPRGDRLTGVIAAVVVGALGVTAALVGVGVSSAGPKLADIGAWLWSSHTESGETSVWDRIEWNGGVAYLSDTLMKTPRGGFPAAPLYQCDDRSGGATS
ncbi:hypothetical protein AB0M95_04850 [Sphaerisporangium sp. NPDC051017]|uniref:hypothetical protein n=1 Tax=Sphaerisporangium sp. NPDC051017 TaxID=3154636 RepID=UPI00341A4C11